MRRVVSAARIHFLTWNAGLYVPLVVLGLSFAINVALFGAIGDTGPERRVTGGLSGLYLAAVFAHLTVITQVFPFAVSLSLTRRAFFASVALVVAAESLLYGVILTLLKALERATGGWGRNVRFFELPYLRQDNPLLQIAVFAVPLAALAFLGVVLGAVFRRWGQAGLYTLSLGALVVLGAAAVLVVWLKWTDAVQSFFTDQPPSAMLAGYPLILVAVAAAASYRLMMRTRL